MLEARLGHGLEAAYQSGSFRAEDYKLPYERAFERGRDIFDKGRNIIDYLSRTSVTRGVMDLGGLVSRAYEKVNPLEAAAGAYRRSIDLGREIGHAHLQKLGNYLKYDNFMGVANTVSRLMDSSAPEMVKYLADKGRYIAKQGGKFYDWIKNKLVGEKKKQGGFTLIELLVVFAIIAVLAGMILAAALSAREHAIRATCKSNLKLIGYNIHLYSEDNEGFMPERRDTPFSSTAILCDNIPTSLGLIISNLGELDVFYCPSANFHTSKKWKPVEWPTTVVVGSSYYYKAAIDPDPGDPSKPLGNYKFEKNNAVVMDFNKTFNLGRHNHGGDFVQILFSDNHIKGVPDKEHKAAQAQNVDIWTWADTK